MKIKLNSGVLWLWLVLLFPGYGVQAQDIAGTWQGTLAVPNGPTLRVVLKITQESGDLKAIFFSIDQGPEGYRAESVTRRGPNEKFSILLPQGIYEGKLSADGRSMEGTWVQGGRLPLDFVKATAATAWVIDASPHTVRLVTVEPQVKLEVLDWGGSGTPLILLTGLGDTAHTYDKFAEQFTARHHVYGITRRGFGDSSAPTPDSRNYSSDRLGDDVLAVMNALQIERPVLVGHSIAGEELSSIGSRHPDKVSGLVYLDAGYPYAFYDRAYGDPQLDMLEIRDRIEDLAQNGGNPIGHKQAIEGLLAALPQLEKDLQNQLRLLDAITPAGMPPETPSPGAGAVSPATAIVIGEHKYTEIKAPSLAIFAVPHDPNSDAIPPTDAAHRAAAIQADVDRTTRLADSFASGVHSARVIRLHNANHYVYRSNEGEVVRAMNDFLNSLPHS